MNRGDFSFEEVSASVGVRRFDSYGGAFADVDGDGDLDLVTNGRPDPEGPREVKLYRNDSFPAPWIAFRLVGPGGDPMPIGAQVHLWANVNFLIEASTLDLDTYDEPVNANPPVGRWDHSGTRLEAGFMQRF